MKQICVEFYPALDIQDGEVFLSNTGYFGSESEPSFQDEVSLAVLMDKYIEEHSIPSQPPTLRSEHREEINRFLDTMSKTIEDARLKVNALAEWK